LVIDRRWAAVGLLIERLESAWLPAFIPPFRDTHIYEPLRVDQFLDALQVAGAHTEGRRYLEVGCGIGTKLLVAAVLGYEVTGIDNRRQYLAVAEWLTRQRAEGEPVPVELENSVPICLEQADARYYDHQFFDVIYANRIIVDNDGQTEYESMLARSMKKGAVLILPNGWNHRPDAWSATEHPWVWVH
jgi:2-polyprenyl-3-methyl-5-hydroxy-6-metoxy-1,4-benzoquinol methylase